jgi:hypothetical protein
MEIGQIYCSICSYLNSLKSHLFPLSQMYAAADIRDFCFY